MTPLAKRIHALLPQTQCTRCGYADCAAYAQAIAAEQAPINQCPPGGAQGIARLAQVTGQAVQALNPAHGVEGPRAVAIIDEVWCIGCTQCLPACPTDAILGSHKQMHTVLENFCTGCGLCLPVCPVDCISLENTALEATGWAAWSAEQAQTALDRYESHRTRLSKNKHQKNAVPMSSDTASLDIQQKDSVQGPKQLTIQTALQQARERRQKSQAPKSTGLDSTD